MTLVEPALVGREAELAELQSFLDRAINGKGNTVFISGEAGVGKTRLLTEFLKIAKKKKVNVLTGWCLSDAAVPYFPFIEAFDSYFSKSEGESKSAVNEGLSLKSWLMSTNHPEVNEKLFTVSPQVWRDQAFGVVTKELLFLSAKRPLILALEDVHWADSASLALVHYLARQVSSERIFILATFRNEELSAEVEGHPNPLSKILHSMGRDSLYKELKLQNLGTSEIERIANSMLRGRVDQRLVERLASDSRGNPLFIVESLRMLFQQGCLSKKNSKWSLVVEDWGFPQKVQDVILRQLEMLTPNQRRILDVASAVGEKFDPKLVASVVSRNNIDVLVDFDQISKSTMIVRNDGDFYRFNHAKSREMLYEGISPILRKEYHSKIAEEIEELDQHIAGLVTSDLAFHYVQAGNKFRAIKYSLEAGKNTLSRLSNEEAINHFSYVLNAVGNEKEFSNERAEALEGLGDAFFFNCMFKDAMRTFENLAESLETGAVKLRALRKAIKSSILFGDNLHTKELVQKAEQYIGADRLENARILMDKALAYSGHRIEKTLEDYLVALRIFEEEFSLSDVASALFVAGALRARLGKPHEGLAESLRSISLYEELNDFRSQMEACFFAGLTLNNCLLSHEAFEMFAKIMEINEKTKLGEYMRLSDANVYLSLLLASAGDFEKALVHGLKALELSKKADSVLSQGMVYSILTMVYTRLGDLKHAKEYFDELMKLPPEILKHTFVRATNAKAVFFAGKNQWEESDYYFNEFFKSLETSPAPAGQAAGRETYAWALEKQGRFAEARTNLAEAQKIRREAKEKFEHANIQTNLMAKAKVSLGQQFEARLDIVNVSRACGFLVRVESLLDPKLDITVFPKGCTLRSDTLVIDEEALGPFHVKTIKLILQANQLGEINLIPKVVYIDDSGKTQICSANKICITVQSPAIFSEEQRIAESPKIEFKFKSEDAQKAFDFLVKAFIEDYVGRRMPVEKSGWRSLMELVKNGKVSKYGVYGFQGHGRHAISELEKRGLVEARVFSGERGRGGNILKLRVSYDNEALKSRLVAKK